MGTGRYRRIGDYEQRDGDKQKTGHSLNQAHLRFGVDNANARRRRIPCAPITYA